MTKTLEDLKQDRQLLNNKINDIENHNRDEKNRVVVGKCFKYRNCFSCPETPADYWWLYSMVISAEDGGLRTFTFQTDRDGEITIGAGAKKFCINMDMHTEIPRKEFETAWASLMDRLAAIQFGQKP